MLPRRDTPRDVKEVAACWQLNLPLRSWLLSGLGGYFILPSKEKGCPLGFGSLSLQFGNFFGIPGIMILTIC